MVRNIIKTYIYPKAKHIANNSDLSNIISYLSAERLLYEKVYEIIPLYSRFSTANNFPVWFSSAVFPALKYKN